MTTIYHYNTNKFGFTAARINESGLIKTEQQLNQFRDGLTLDCAYFTENPHISNAALSVLLNLMKRLGNSDVTDEQLAQIEQQNAGWQATLTRYEFDADEIGAERWRPFSRRWHGVSPKKRKLIDRLEYYNEINADSSDQHWVTTRAVPLTLCRSTHTETIAFQDVLSRSGFRNLAQYYRQMQQRFGHRMHRTSITA